MEKLFKAKPEEENSLEKLGSDLQKLEFDSGIFLYIETPGIVFPEKIAERLVKYSNEVVLANKENRGRSDCATVAGDAVRALEKYFENNGFAIGTMGTGTGEKLLQFYSNLGYGHHVINFIESESMFASIDLTSSYTMDIKNVGPSVFSVTSSTEAELKTKLGELTNSRWETR